jgi:hypothetical protein
MTSFLPAHIPRANLLGCNHASRPSDQT